MTPTTELGEAGRRCPRCGEIFPDDYAVCPRDATPLSTRSTEDSLIGETLADTYEVVSPIAEGGMGRVYRVRHRRLGRDFALKVMHAELARTPDAVTRFRREATAASAITSQYVAQVIDVDVMPDGRPYLVSELLDGEELGELLDREGALDVPFAAEIGRQLCRAIGAAHRAGVVHRDLKPDNVMLVRDNDGTITVKVVDFGIAKTLGSGPSLTRTGIVMGTPSYMAPEQAAGQTDVDHHADIYALGAILYHMLTGRKPFNSEDVATTLAMVLRDEPERPSTLCGAIPAALELVIQRAMSKLPRDRYHSAAELEHVLIPFASTSHGADQSSSRSAIDSKAATVYMESSGSEVRAAKGARTRVVLFTVALELVGFLSVAALTGDGIRAWTGQPLSLVEAVLAMVLGLVATLPITISWMRHLAQGTWRNTLIMTLHAATLSRVLAVALGFFAMVVAGAHFAYLVALGKEGVPPYFLTAAWGVALTAIVFPALVGMLRSRRRR